MFSSCLCFMSYSLNTQQDKVALVYHCLSM
nr:MAG TPA: hypothetical protein [Caudoviricetes sp.]